MTTAASHSGRSTGSAAGAYPLQHLALAAIAALSPGPQGRGSPELAFLDGFLADLPDVSWREELNRNLSAPHPEDQALVSLGDLLDLSPLELCSTALALVVERDLLAGRAVALLQAPVGGSRPTLGLLARAFRGLTRPDQAPILELLTGDAVASGLLVVEEEGATLPERTIRIPDHLTVALLGAESPPPNAVIGLGSREAVPLPPSFLDAAVEHARGLGQSEPRLLVIRSGSPAEARSVAQAIAVARGVRAAFLDPDRPATGLGPWLHLRRCLPVFNVELGPGERKRLPSIPGYEGPVVGIAGPDGSLGTEGLSALVWTLPVAGRRERELLWTNELADPALAARLARDHRHGCGRIAHLGRLARHRAQLRGETSPDAGDVTAVSRGGEGDGFAALAQALPEPIPDQALVVPASLRRDLDALLLRCRWRDELDRGLGVTVTARYHPGVRVLFSGPTGTGKTLAAAWLTTRLGLPLYRVDLASVTSKYIGETEKNLAQLLARAEQSEVVLLFDEADSMFGKRTDVRDANDRFANAQTNYLLQRIESYDGIVILTTNSAARLDAAFTRRLDAILEFPLPGPEQRRALWRGHLGPHHGLTPEALNLISAKAEFGGGHIRNAVLAAQVLAREADRPIGLTELLAGIAAEFRKLGRQPPAELTSAGRAPA